MRNYSLQNYFYYTRLERNAGIILCVLCGLSFCLPLFYPLFIKPAPKMDFSGALQMADGLAPATASFGKRNSSPSFRGINDAQATEVKLASFDPNTATKDELMQLGLPSRTAQSILNYRAKGGRFFKKEDLKRIYTLQPADYERLEPFIQIQDKENLAANFSKKTDNQGFASKIDFEEKPATAPNLKDKKAAFAVDINSATAEDWQQIRGIGPYWAKRIVSYREKLGGFSSPAQVAETKGLPDSVFQKALPQLKVEMPIFRAININTATLEELKKHPYLNGYQATILFNYRLQHGHYTDIASMKKVKAGFTDEDWRRLEPYLSFD